MRPPIFNTARVPLGHEWLRQTFGLRVPPPALESYTIAGTRRTEVYGMDTVEYYPRSYATGDSLAANLRFAFRHEPIDLGTLVGALKAVDPKELETWVRAEPTGAFSRRAWFFYETFTGRTLDVEDVRTGNYIDALDPERHVTGDRCNSPRHRVVDNLLGGRALCPVIRRTAKLRQQMSLHIDDEAKALIAGYDPLVLVRAVSYLYTKETRSSFAIEGETPNASRTERFVAALRAAPGFDPGDKAALIRLQGQIVDSRYAASDWRDFQNFVGETIGGYREEVHFICPRPEDVPGLMAGWAAMMRRLDTAEPVAAAAAAAFAFVFVHPFEDGNGRIHRFLMHHVLAKRGYSPPGIIFPVSAAILRDRAGYDAALERFSRRIAPCIEWHWTGDQQIVVENDTADLYRYFDATHFAEYLYDRVTETVRSDLREELGFVAVFDRATTGVREIVDMPDRRVSLFVRLCIQNGGRLSAGKRGLFGELSDAEVAALEEAVIGAMRG